MDEPGSASDRSPMLHSYSSPQRAPRLSVARSAFTAVLAGGIGRCRSGLRSQGTRSCPRSSLKSLLGFVGALAPSSPSHTLADTIVYTFTTLAGAAGSLGSADGTGSARSFLTHRAWPGHYNGIASQAAGKTCFAIKPENVDQIAVG